MKEILVPFSKAMVLANLEGRKTATRRMSAKYGKVKKGDIILMGEALIEVGLPGIDPIPGIAYEADLTNAKGRWRWRRPRLPSIFMPREFVRACFEVTRDAYQQLVFNMTEEDAIKEGVQAVISKKIHGWTPNCLEFSLLWDSINGKTCPWRSNPTPWVIEYKRVQS